MSEPRSTVLVTGAAGFLGPPLIAALVADGVRVRALDDGSEGDPERLAAFGDRIERIHADVRDGPALAASARGCDTIFHLAVRREAGPLEAHAVNAEGTLAVLEAARAGAGGRVVVASSWRVYGDAEAPWDEAREPSPRDAFGLQKRCGERYAALYARLHGLPTVALRYAPLLGPDGPVRPIPDALRPDAVSVEDAVRATRLAAASDEAVGGAWNVGSGAGRLGGTRARERLGFAARSA